MGLFDFVKGIGKENTAAAEPTGCTYNDNAGCSTTCRAFCSGSGK